MSVVVFSLNKEKTKILFSFKKKKKKSMSSPSTVKFDLWRQLQLLSKITHSEKNKDGMKVLLQSLRQFHSREPSAPSSDSSGGVVRAVALPRSIFWRLFFGILPLPGTANASTSASANLLATVPQQQQQVERNSPEQKIVASSPTASSPTSNGKKNLFASSSDDDDDHKKNKTEESEKSATTTTTTTTAAPTQIGKNLTSKSMFTADSDDDDENVKSKTTNSNNNNSGNSSTSSAAYTPELIRSTIDTAREEYSEWLKKSKKMAAEAEEHQQQEKKMTFGSSKKKKTESTSAATGPRFGDDSSDSDSDDDGSADPLSSPNNSKKNNNSNNSASSPTEASSPQDPLAHANDPKWQKYFARKKEMELIDKDLNRLYFDNYDFFELPATRRKVRNILEASLDLEVVNSYSQGMHEVAGLVLWVLDMDATRFGVSENSSSSDDDAEDTLPGGVKKANDAGRGLTSHIMSAKHTEHDAFVVFKQVIKTFDLGAWYDNQFLNSEKSITKIVDDIHGRRLARVDKPLHDHLQELDVPVATYGLRWLRLLFIREFPLSQTMKLWDVIFADFAVSKQTVKVWESVVPEIALSMLLFIARELVQSDHTDTLRRLMRYPPVEDITMIYINAIARSTAAASPLRELIPASDNDSSQQQPASPKKSQQHQDPEQQHQNSLFQHLTSIITTSAHVVSSGAHAVADKTKAVVGAAIHAARLDFGATSSSSDDDDDDEKKKQKAKKASAAGDDSKKSPPDTLEVYAMKQKMKMLANRIDRIIIDKFNGSDSEDEESEEAKKKAGQVSEAQIRSAIAELRKIREELTKISQ